MTDDLQNTCNEQRYEALYRAHAALLFNYIYYRCGDRAGAEDIVQESFLELWRNCQKVSPEMAKAYLFRVARNKMLNILDRKKVRLAYASEYDKHQSPASESPQFLLEEEEFRKVLEEAIGALPSSQREVFLLNRVDGLKYREMAELLGISQKAVEKRMHKALVHLRKVYRKI